MTIGKSRANPALYTLCGDWLVRTAFLSLGVSRGTKSKQKTETIVPGGVDEYIENCPEAAQTRLRELRSAVPSAALGSTETVSYFQMPGYFYEGYDYNGMFAWFSFKKPYVRLHVRPPVLEDNKNDVEGFVTTKAIVASR